MGELRFNGGQSGAWIRTYGNKYNVADGSGVGYQQTQQGFSLGVDTPLGDGGWLIGVLAGHSKSDLDLNRGTSGTVKSYYVGPYVTWLDADRANKHTAYPNRKSGVLCHINSAYWPVLCSTSCRA